MLTLSSTTEQRITPPPRMITVATDNPERPVVLFLWHTIAQLRVVLECTGANSDVMTSRSDRSDKFYKSFPDIHTYLTDTGVFYIAVKCGAFDEFASFNHIRTTLDGLGLLSDYRLGETMYRIKHAMKKYAHRYLSEEAGVSMDYGIGCDSADNDDVLSHGAHMQISNVHRNIIHRFYEGGDK